MAVCVTACGGGKEPQHENAEQLAKEFFDAALADDKAECDRLSLSIERYAQDNEEFAAEFYEAYFQQLLSLPDDQVGRYENFALENYYLLERMPVFDWNEDEYDACCE